MRKKIGWILLLGTLALAFPACQRESDTQETQPEARDTFHVLSFSGPHQVHFLMHFDGGRNGATLFTGTETLRLDPEFTGQGTKYVGERLAVWPQGQDIVLEVDGKRVGPCAVSGLQSILSKAWLSGADFWAVGSEPDWNLVLGGDRVLLLTNLGQDKLEFPPIERGTFDPRHPAGQYTLVQDGHRLTIEISESLCTNPMSGEPFAASVSLTLDDQPMRGCGTGLF